MKNERIKKRRYKTFTYFCVFLLLVVAGVGLALGVWKMKVKAGVIVDTQYIKLDYPAYLTPRLKLEEVESAGVSYWDGFGAATTTLFALNLGDTTNTYYIISIRNYDGETAGKARVQLSYSTLSGTNAPAINAHYTELDLIEIEDTVYYMLELNALKNELENVGLAAADFTITRRNPNCEFFKKVNAISAIENIFNLEKNNVVLIYINDVDGLAQAMTDEIIINWGYIDTNDNEIFSIYAPKIGAQLVAADDLTVRLSVPTNDTGTASNTYDISQRAILSLGEGSATASAHIYGIYVWLLSNRIQWGLAEFDTSGTPASAYSMNYITKLTPLYDYTAANTNSMTCRLSISDNFNFLVVKNQPILSAQDINTVIQQGGFLPAWALYNWARGSASGYVAGEQAGAAQYQPGNPGYQEIYEAGRQAGIAENIGTTNWFISSFQAVDAFLNIRIFPNITFGYLLGIPFIISLVWFIIRMFRGGGGD